MLLELFQKMSHEAILKIPGVYQEVEDYLNERVIDVWEERNLQNPQS